MQTTLHSWTGEKCHYFLQVVSSHEFFLTNLDHTNNVEHKNHETSTHLTMCTATAGSFSHSCLMVTLNVKLCALDSIWPSTESYLDNLKPLADISKTF